jgi:hypothetical protein
MAHGQYNDQTPIEEIEYCVRETVDQHSAHVPVEDRIHFRAASNLSEPSFNTKEKIRPKPRALRFIPSEGFLDVPFSLRANKDGVLHLGAVSLRLICSQEEPSPGDAR